MQKTDSIENTYPEVSRLVGTGWGVVAASIIGLFFHFGSLLVITFSLFLKPLSEQFNWTRAQVSLAFTLACLTALCSMTLIGWLTDRFGARHLIIISMSLFGALFASLSLLTPHLWFLYAVFAILGLIGPGTSAVPHASLISRWFTARRGLIGFGYGAETSAAPYLTSLYFGLRSFGEIYSYLFLTVPFGGALGPALMGVGFDRTGSYQLTLSLCFVAMLAAALLMLRLRFSPTFKE